MLEACPISDALITQIPADEEPLCRNAAVYAVIIIMMIMIIIIKNKNKNILINYYECQFFPYPFASNTSCCSFLEFFSSIPSHSGVLQEA